MLDAKKLYLVALESANDLPDSSPRKRQALFSASGVYLRDNNPKQAIALAKLVVAMDEKAPSPQNSQVAADLGQLAVYYEQVDKSKGARLYDRAVKEAEATQDMDCFERIGLFENAASFYATQKRYPEAEALLRQAMDPAVDLPTSERDFMRARDMLARVLISEGKNAEAEELVSTPVARSSLRGSIPSNLDLAAPLRDLSLADQHKAQGRQQEAELFYRYAISSLEGFPPRLGLAALSSALDGLGEICHAQGRDSEAEELLLRSLDLKEKNAGPEMLDIIRILGSPFALENFYREEGRLSEMEQIYRQIIQIQEKYLDPQDDALVATFLSAACLFVEVGKPEESLPIYRRAIQYSEQNSLTDNARLLFILSNYASALDASGHPAEANQVRAREKSVQRKPSS
jgi:tetratricopeptide (TPR) repeat protein